MAKRKTGASSPSQQQAAPDPLCKALQKRNKAELVDVLVQLAGSDRDIRRDLEARFAVKLASKELVQATRAAITDAAYFNPREMNTNFAYDYAAYEAVEKNFRRLIDQGHLEQTMELALELMRLGSAQVEMSDKGLMHEDIEKCLRVVLDAIPHAQPPTAAVERWCSAMQQSDRVGFICNPGFERLRSWATQR
jgi:hypothetical protein